MLVLGDLAPLEVVVEMLSSQAKRVTYTLSNARNIAVQLPTPDEFATHSTAPEGALFSNLE
jgi:hypothetical protein